ncbi:PspA-associated protein PspAB [Nocardioides daphniae]|uniref:Uncharacterized protein n=1 Tax=Nocardioides daphniae TaxID=402297 RepID=A0ABQ1Q7U0_9ACTN|nr:hypothetical protein [Nocardioides daphniae]GGD18064.1 hypothetical protein GCM10007231_16430 [Nocardioides daphniae]
MGFLDAILGRSRPARPRLDALFSIPNAAVTLETSLGLTPTGTGAVCYRAADGVAFARLTQEIDALIESGVDAPDASTSTDGYGFTWLTVRGGADDLSTLCTNLHVVNSTLEEQGFGHGLLCTLVPFEAPDGRRVGLVYLYKQGTFYPFAPVKGTRRRDNMLELQVRDQLAGELEIEEDLQRWLALWDAPGL